MINKLKNSKIAILWYGLEGKSSLQFLLKNWILSQNITILDKNNIEIQNFDWKIITWENYLNDLDNYDFIIKSPWISPYTNWLLKYKDKLLTQAMIFYSLYKWKIISITQTKWKSTTATLTYEVLKNAWFKTKLVWNIWNPVLDEIDFNETYDFVVFELSSYMLEGFENHHSYISIIWNIYEDHLDWHEWFENYSNAKLNVLKNAENILVWLNLYHKIQNHLLNRKFLSFGWELAYYSHIKNNFFINKTNIGKNINPKIPGDHNLDNISWILWVCDIIWVPLDIFEKTINSFEWLNHRLKNIWTYNWITFIDDAISTTPESTIMWIKSFSWKIDTIFLGWTDRWYHFEELVKILDIENIKNIVLFPPSWNKIKPLLDNFFNIIETSSMQEAVNFAFKFTKSWKICLLSTASPSYSIWKNFEEKWDLFYKEILKYIKK